MKRTMTTLLALFLSFSALAQRDSLVVVFWNVENFYDWKDSGTSDSDSEFSSGGLKHWTKSRFHTKCDAVSKVLLKIGDSCGRLPDVVGLAEVENAFVLKQLVESTVLRKLDYSWVHFDSPDHRGIDCALLYRRSSLDLRGAEAKHLYDSTGQVIPTRDILLAEFDGLDILVNHHPSKVGEGSSERRKTAMDRLFGVCDSLVACGHSSWLAIGDFNDDIWHSGGKGTVKYHGGWEKIDGHLAYGLEVQETVFEDPLLSERDKSWGGVKPLRTYIGPRYTGGVSDHYPIVLTIKSGTR